MAFYKMHEMATFITLMILMPVAVKQVAGNPSNEFCNGETFRPRCAGGKNDVIVILAARYGRMSFGRCLEENPAFASMATDPLFLGCSADVKQAISRQCSGRSECDIRVNDQNFDGIKPCYADLKMHLEASFVCLKVAAESRHCTVAVNTEPQHIVGGSRSQLIQSDTVGCGVESHPWSVEALAGQRIAVSITDFESTGNESSHLPGCRPREGVIVDRAARKNISLCAADAQSSTYRDVHGGDTLTKLIHVSRSNQLQIITNENIDKKIIVRVEAVGCSDLTPPSDDAWLKRVDDQITVGCYMTRQSWQLNCVNGVWTGTVGVCNQYGDNKLINDVEKQSSLSSDGNSASKQTEVAALAAVASAGLAVCCLVICVGIMCLRRQQQRKNKPIYDPRDDVNSCATARLTVTPNSC